MKEKLNTAEKFFRRELAREAKHLDFGKSVLSDLSWMKLLPKDNEWHRRWAAINALITRDLKDEHLWKDDYDKNCSSLENGIPGLQKKQGLKKRNPKDENSAGDREEITDTFGNALIAEEALEIEEIETYYGERLDLNGVAAQKDLDDLGECLFSFRPRLAVSPVSALLRRYPRSLKESLARDLVSSGRYQHLCSKNLHAALFFYEVGIDDETTFLDVRLDAYVNCQHHRRGKEFDFSEYRRDLLRLFRILADEKRHYFDGNRALLRIIRSKNQGKLQSIWSRFEAARESLSIKQWNAIKQVRVKKRAQLEVAKGMEISLDSLRDRLESAELKFRNAIPEFAPLSPSKSHKTSAKCNFSDSGLLDKREAMKVASLYRIDPKTGARTEIPQRRGKKLLRNNLNRAEIKAWAHDSTPVPDFSFTDFFTNMLPKAQLERRKGPPIVHEISSQGCSFATKLAMHKKRNPIPEE